MLIVSKTTPPFVLKEIFYTRYKQKENRKFLLTEAVLPPLTLTEEIVLLSVSPTDAVYFQDPDKIKETRFVYSRVFAEESCEILFSTISHSKYKIWLNGRLGTARSFAYNIIKQSTVVIVEFDNILERRHIISSLSRDENIISHIIILCKF